MIIGLFATLVPRFISWLLQALAWIPFFASFPLPPFPRDWRLGNNCCVKAGILHSQAVFLLHMCENRNRKTSWNGRVPKKDRQNRSNCLWFKGWIELVPHPQWIQLFVAKVGGLFSFHLPVFVVPLLFFLSFSQSKKGRGIKNDSFTCQSILLKTLRCLHSGALSWERRRSVEVYSAQKKTCSWLQDTFLTFPFKVVLEEWQVVFLTWKFKENLL